MVNAARARASAAYTTLTELAQQAAQMNFTRLRAGRPPLQVGTYSPPNAPSAPGVSASDVARMLDGQAQWFASEIQRLRAEMHDAAGAPQPARTLAPAPRPVPTLLTFVEVTRTPWLWLRWLLFPPFTMMLIAGAGALATQSAVAAAGLIVAAVALAWGVGINRGLQRVALLARGEVPVTLQREEKIYRTRNTNIPMLRANGWDVRLESYTGMSRGTIFVVQTTRGVIGRVSVDHGHPFDGVLLVDPETAVGCAHMEFASLPVPDERGQWQVQVPTRVWLGLVGGVIISSALMGFALALLLGLKVVSNAGGEHGSRGVSEGARALAAVPR